MITEPTVALVAHTIMTEAAEELLTWERGVEDSDRLAEFAGRACYQSWNRPNPKTAANADYLAHILQVDHQSVLSHASATFYIQGVSRNLTHELIRSRWLSFSELSQRYVSAADFDWVCPPLALHNPHWQRSTNYYFGRMVEEYQTSVEQLQVEARVQGWSGTELRKRIREASRGMLPGHTETKIVVSGNLRAWRDFIAQRWSVHADLEIQRLAGLILGELRTLAPATFADFNEEQPAA